MSENRKAKQPIRPRVRPQTDDQATRVSELVADETYPISLPGAWPSVEAGMEQVSHTSHSSESGETYDFTNNDSSNTTPIVDSSLSAMVGEESYALGFEAPITPEDSDFAFPKSIINEQEQIPIAPEDSDFAFPESNFQEQEQIPLAPEDSDFAFPNVSNERQDSVLGHEKVIAIALSEIHLEEEPLKNAGDTDLSDDRSSLRDTREALAIADDDPIPVTESGATEFQEEVTRVAAMETISAQFELDAEPLSLPSHLSPLDETESGPETAEQTPLQTTHLFSRQKSSDSVLKDNSEGILVVIESRNTSTREVSLSKDEFAIAEQQILENRFVHIPGKVLVLDAVAIFRQVEQTHSRRRRRSA